MYKYLIKTGIIIKVSNIKVIKIHNPINIYFNFITTFLDNTIIIPVIINNGTIKDISVSVFNPSH